LGWGSSQGAGDSSQVLYLLYLDLPDDWDPELSIRIVAGDYEPVDPALV
jgi:hypothetical protein